MAVGLAGAGIAVAKGEMDNAATNSLFLVGAGGAFFIDLKVRDALKEKTKEEVSNPYLKGDLTAEEKTEEE